ncbi:MAG: histidine phosphatase family protein [Lewinellaceae bacterium]|nr:histidine phosphatase family protein [Saprospiraceae bacterium]MCB9341045.1 histidine phosphatase family protein [Lewinellaceae bacterium]
MSQKLPFYSVFLFAIFSLFIACKKDPEVITKTVIEKDTVLVTQIDTVFVTLTDTVSLTNYIQDTATTFILIRHAETTGTGTNPNLSAEGLARAEELIRILKNVELKAVYSTNYNRTLQTAQLTGGDHGLIVDQYIPSALNSFADDVLLNHHGSNVLVVGHSNTTPDLLNVLTGLNSYTDIPEMEYDNLYLVTVFEKGRAEVLHLKYGKPTP